MIIMVSEKKQERHAMFQSKSKKKEVRNNSDLKKINKLIVPGGSKKTWGLSSLSLSPREIPPRHLPWGSYRKSICL